MKIDGRELFLESYRCAKREKRDFLLENEAAEICRSYDLPLPDNGFAESKEAAFSVASKLGYPVVVKLVSPQVIHKSDVGAVRVGVDSRINWLGHGIRSWAASESISRRRTSRVS